MSDSKLVEAAPDALTGALSLDVSFTFDRRWAVGPVDAVTIFPPGGLGLGLETIDIAAVHLKGLSNEQIAAAVAKRADDMALVATAIAVANRQFAAALSEAGYGTTAS